MFGDGWKEDPRWNVLYYGIDFEPFSQQPTTLRSELGIPENRFVIGHVGRFEPQKNHAFLLEIARATIERCSRAHFLLIGDGSLRDAFMARVRDERLEDRFTFVRDCTTVPQHMISAMDCFVFPSLYEGLGLVAVEAQAAGLHCVMSDMVPEEAAVNPDLVTVLSLRSKEPWAAELARIEQSPSSSKQKDLSLFTKSRFNIDECVARLSATYEGARYADGPASHGAPVGALPGHRV